MPISGRGTARETYQRGVSYVDFAPDRVAMQDATAQMALLQFMQSGRDPFRAEYRTLRPPDRSQDQQVDLTAPYMKAVKRMISWLLFPINTASVSGNRRRYHPPGSALKIMLFPGGMMIGTDSHTKCRRPRYDCDRGVGADACDVMAGLPWELKMPKLIGVKLPAN